MKNKLAARLTALLAVTVMAGSLLTGCGAKADEANSEEPAAEVTEEAPKADEEGEVPGAPYFTKGVYKSYADGATEPDPYFYIFDSESAGHTDDGNTGTGLPFDAEQKDGSIAFTFGGEGELESVFTVTEADNGLIKGYFDDEKEPVMIFELLEGEDPASFNAQNYVNGPENSVYHDPNGWSVKYNANVFDVNQENGNVFFVYTGESAGTNMITVTYTVDNKGEAAIKELGESWGKDTEFHDGPFPGAEDVTGYWATLTSSGDDSGLCMTAVGRDYMEGALIFEMTEHQSGDDELDMEVSDQLAAIIDSLTFETYEDSEDGDGEALSPVEKDMEVYKSVIDGLEDGTYYAFADMDKDFDALLVADADLVYEDEDGNMTASEAKVYGLDKDGKVKEYGEVKGGGTATPLACANSTLFYGGRDYMNKVHIDEAKSEMVVEEGEFFDEYEKAVHVVFTAK